MLMGYPCELAFTLAIIAIAQFLSPASLHFWATAHLGHSMTTYWNFALLQDTTARPLGQPGQQVAFGSRLRSEPRLEEPGRHVALCRLERPQAEQHKER